MPFVKLDCGILNSTLWVDRIARELFITSLLMAEPFEVLEPTPQIAIGSLELTGWEVPPGWYGFVPAAGPGIIRRAGYDRDETYAAGIEALRRLGDPDPESRSKGFDGRRMVRVDGGFLILNYIAYREKDATSSDRSRRWRERQKMKPTRATRVTATPTRVIRHQAEAEVQVQADTKTTDAPDLEYHRFQMAYPESRRKGGYLIETLFFAAISKASIDDLLTALENHKASEQWLSGKIPGMDTWLRDERWHQRLDPPKAQWGGWKPSEVP